MTTSSRPSRLAVAISSATPRCSSSEIASTCSAPSTHLPLRSCAVALATTTRSSARLSRSRGSSTFDAARPTHRALDALRPATSSSPSRSIAKTFCPRSTAQVAASSIRTRARSSSTTQKRCTRSGPSPAPPWAARGSTSPAPSLPATMACARRPAACSAPAAPRRPIVARTRSRASALRPSSARRRARPSQAALRRSRTRSVDDSSPRKWASPSTARTCKRIPQTTSASTDRPCAQRVRTARTRPSPSTSRRCTASSPQAVPSAVARWSP